MNHGLTCNRHMKDNYYNYNHKSYDFCCVGRPAYLLRDTKITTTPTVITDKQKY